MQLSAFLSHMLLNKLSRERFHEYCNVNFKSIANKIDSFDHLMRVLPHFSIEQCGYLWDVIFNNDGSLLIAHTSQLIELMDALSIDQCREAISSLNSNIYEVIKHYSDLTGISQKLDANKFNVIIESYKKNLGEFYKQYRLSNLFDYTSFLKSFSDKENESHTLVRSEIIKLLPKAIEDCKEEGRWYFLAEVFDCLSVEERQLVCSMIIESTDFINLKFGSGQCDDIILQTLNGYNEFARKCEIKPRAFNYEAQRQLIQLHRHEGEELFTQLEKLVLTSPDPLKRFLVNSNSDTLLLIYGIYQQHMKQINTEEGKAHWNSILTPLLFILPELEKTQHGDLLQKSDLLSLKTQVYDKIKQLTLGTENRTRYDELVREFPEKLKDLLLTSLDNYSSFKTVLLKIKGKVISPDPHKETMLSIIDTFGWEILCLYKIMGADTFKFLNTYISNNVLKLTRFLENFSINDKKQLEWLAKLYDAHSKQIYKSDGKTQWGSILEQITQLFNLYNELNQNLETIQSALDKSVSLEQITATLTQLQKKGVIAFIETNGLTLDPALVEKKLKHFNVRHLLEAWSSLEDRKFKEVFIHMLHADFDPKGVDYFLHNTDDQQEGSLGHRIASHNRAVRDELRKGKINVTKALSYKEVMRFSDTVISDETITTQITSCITSLWSKILELNDFLEKPEFSDSIKTEKSMKILKSGLTEIIGAINRTRDKKKNKKALGLKELHLLSTSENVNRVLNLIN